MPGDADKIEIENLNSPGRVERVDRGKYMAMKAALLAVLPKSSPGLTVAEAKAELLPLLPVTLFPEGARVTRKLQIRRYYVQKHKNPIQL